MLFLCAPTSFLKSEDVVTLCNDAVLPISPPGEKFLKSRDHVFHLWIQKANTREAPQALVTQKTVPALAKLSLV